MAKIHGESGALTDLLEVVADPNIRTLAAVVEFNKNFDSEKATILAGSRAIVGKQIADSETRLSQILYTISVLESRLATAKSMAKLITSIRLFFKKRDAVRLGTTISNTETNIEALTQEHALQPLSRIERIWKLLQEHKFSIYGAIGEEKTIAELQKLPDEYIVINDFRRHFHRPIYNRREDDRIYSIQVDHIVVGPTGLFILETKYWSKQSINNEDLFSPVQQVKRAAFALFVYLNHAVNSNRLRGFESNWGKKKVSPKQIVVSVNPVPHTAFQFVKVLNVSNLVQHITSGSHEFSSAEIESISSFLMHHNSKR